MASAGERILDTTVRVPWRSYTRSVRLLVATTNRGKLREIRDLLADLPIELATLDEVPRSEAPEETGRTFAENAQLKARHYASATGLLTVAEDSGLEIDALGGAPGVGSARFGGVNSSYADKFALIYQRLRRPGAAAAHPGGAITAAAATSRPTARFVCALAVAEGASILFESRGTVEGEIAPKPQGDGGFGYDPIFYYPPLGCTLAEAGRGKGEVSHRGNAFRHLRSWLISQVLRSSPPP
ncbi:MAG: non-canonical purine NTP pyrophosphatase [Luteitalea sp.]|nr:non-canonical purine NTP pyrophosphatase [Luteitalea sp.]